MDEEELEQLEEIEPDLTGLEDIDDSSETLDALLEDVSDGSDSQEISIDVYDETDQSYLVIPDGYIDLDVFSEESDNGDQEFESITEDVTSEEIPDEEPVTNVALVPTIGHVSKGERVVMVVKNGIPTVIGSEGSGDIVFQDLGDLTVQLAGVIADVVLVNDHLLITDGNVATAGTTATNYILADSNGIKIAKNITSSSKAYQYITSTANEFFTQVNSTATSVAKFGADGARIGLENGWKVTIDDSGMHITVKIPNPASGSSNPYLYPTMDIAGGYQQDAISGRAYLLLNSALKIFTNSVQALTNLYASGRLDVVDNASIGGALDVTGAISSESTGTFNGNLRTNASALTRGEAYSSDTMGNGLYLRDSEGVWMSRLVPRINSTIEGSFWQSRRNINNEEVTAGISLGVKADGDTYIGLSGNNIALAWRSAIGANNANNITSGTLGIARGGTGSTGLTTMSTVSSVITAASTTYDFSAAVANVWGPICQINITFQTSTAISSSTQIGTIASAYRPKQTCYGRAFYSNSNSVSLASTGALRITQAPANTSISLSLIFFQSV